MKKQISWFRIGNTRYGVAKRSTCEVCGKPIVLGNRLDVWLHEDRIRKGVCHDHEALPAGKPQAQRRDRSPEHGDKKEGPPEAG